MEHWAETLAICLVFSQWVGPLTVPLRDVIVEKERHPFDM